MQPQPLVLANWKLNGDRQLVTSMVSALRDAADSLHGVNVGICPPAIYIPALTEACYYDAIGVGVQHISEHPKGAYTGELAVSMVKEFGVDYVLIGHSERRSLYQESDQQVAAKVAQVTSAGLTAVVCVGESEAQREAGETLTVVKAQLAAALQGLAQSSPALLVIAYEPVWAIGTGQTATPEQAQQVHAEIRSWLQQQLGDAGKDITLLYGGSVKPDNAAELFAQADINGGLIGGASLVADDFIAICQAARG
ncbi:triose-phosphate isomerase [Idiomarina xiamenensis]|uniref:Triosephosphate isomerase n=1 Tax=Idiomarina xiamenensis 10-D-4 TaxID=740709 RepID=K2JUX7_9GAMM|nr:triose-phosphate isomerase [Idiomarina xiamenensis]EKE79318.1 triosephosphate isomerase [Idiomarina xiamenensis 10-D-4]